MNAQLAIVFVFALGYAVAPDPKDNSLDALQTIWRYKKAFQTCENKLNYGCRCSFMSIESLTCDFKCISLERRCDGNQDCPLGDDEENCPDPLCPKGSMCCLNGTCATLCDGVPDCEGAVDEVQCDGNLTTQCTGEMLCLNGECATVCDGNAECIGDLDTALDEKDCRFSCPADQLVCDSGECAAVCDGTGECALAFDETKCLLECDVNEVSCNIEPSDNPGCAEFCESNEECNFQEWATEDPYCGTCQDCDPFCQKRNSPC